MKDVLIIGGGGHARVIIDIVKHNTKFNIRGYSDLENRGDILGVKYLGRDEFVIESHKNLNAVLSIGKMKIVENRINIYRTFIKNGFGFPQVIAEHAIIGENVIIGNGAVIMNCSVVNAGSEIGELAIINTHTAIEHDCKIGINSHIASGVTLGGGVIIGNNCVIGMGSNIIQNVRINDDVFIGAGSLVLKDIKEPGVYVGNPLRKIR